MEGRLTIQTFEELSAQELYAILRLRSDVFVVEQDCVYQDLDNKDQLSIHLSLYDENELVGYTRILAPGLSYPEHASIGRVVTHRDHRKSGHGVRIMEESIRYCKDQFSQHDIKISAQSYLDRFYKQFGFEDIGDHYLEDGIPHQAMILSFERK